MSDIKAMRNELREQAKSRRAAMSFGERRQGSEAICAKLCDAMDKMRTSRFGGLAAVQDADRSGELVGIGGSSSGADRPFRLGVYSAFDEEVNLDSLIMWAFENGIEVCFPCMTKDARKIEGCCDQTMEFRRVCLEDYLATKETLAGKGSTRKVAVSAGERGIPFLLHPLRRYNHDSKELCDQPYVAPDEIDFLVCPCVAVDKQGNRLGYGAGNYDRYLSQLKIRDIDEAAAGVSSMMAGGECVVVCVAFEEQVLDLIPAEAHDIPLSFVSPLD